MSHEFSLDLSDFIWGKGFKKRGEFPLDKRASSKTFFDLCRQRRPNFPRLRVRTSALYTMSQASNTELL